MTSKNWREKVRGVERETLDLLSEVITSEQWVQLLRGPLARAVAQGNRDLAQKLVGVGAENGDALHIAVRGGHEGIVNDLLDNGAPLNGKEARATGATDESKGSSGKSPLHVAAEEGNKALVELLLVKGGEKDALDAYSCTPLFLATTQGQVAAAIALLSAGADANLRSGYKGSPLTVALQTDRPENVDIVRALIDHGADIRGTTNSWSQESVLHLAACKSTGGAIDALVEAGADMEARDRDGATPLHHAAQSPRNEAVGALLKRGADVNVEDFKQSTPLHYAATARKYTVGTIDMLVEAGGNFEARDADGWSPLHRAAKLLRTRAAAALMKNGADVNAQGPNESTPLHYAAAMAGRQSGDGPGAASMVELLLRSGADEMIVDEDGNAPEDMVLEPESRYRLDPEEYVAMYGEGDPSLYFEREEEEQEEEDLRKFDVEAVRELLEYAPADRADRAQRLRVYLVLCRAHPDRIQQVYERNSAQVGAGRRTHSATKLSRAEGSRGDGGSMVAGRTGVGWASVVARVVGLQEEGIFRAIVGYL